MSMLSAGNEQQVLVVDRPARAGCCDRCGRTRPGYGIARRRARDGGDVTSAGIAGASAVSSRSWPSGPSVATRRKKKRSAVRCAPIDLRRVAPGFRRQPRNKRWRCGKYIRCAQRPERPFAAVDQPIEVQQQAFGALFVEELIVDENHRLAVKPAAQNVIAGMAIFDLVPVQHARRACRNCRRTPDGWCAGADRRRSAWYRDRSRHGWHG